jgi:hypothetical protein
MTLCKFISFGLTVFTLVPVSAELKSSTSKPQPVRQVITIPAFPRDGGAPVPPVPPQSGPHANPIADGGAPVPPVPPAPNPQLVAEDRGRVKSIPFDHAVQKHC